MLLLVDNSNRTTKLALGDGNGVDPASLRRLPSAGLSVENLQGAIAGMPRPQAVCWASVTHDGPSQLSAFAEALGVPGHALDSTNAGLGLGQVDEPSAIGPDRLANAIAAAAHFPGRTVIAIDAGTAITFNVVRTEGTARPEFLGGAIAPGLGMFTHWLSHQTARLPDFPFPSPDEPAPPSIGRSTVPALRAAAWHGTAGMVKEIIARQSAEAGAPPALVLTGSDAPALAAMLGNNILVDPLLTLDGIRLAFIARIRS